MRTWDIVIYVLPVQRPSSSPSIPLSDSSLTKMETKDDCKAWEAVRALLLRTAISYPARKRETEREGGQQR